MLHIPILRHGQPYESVEKIDLVHHATGAVIGHISQANSGMISRDIGRMNEHVLDALTVADLMDMSRKAGELFLAATLPCGNEQQSFAEYIRQLSATTGMPISYCNANANKIHRVFADIHTVIAGLTRGFPLDILDRGHGQVAGHTLSFFRTANCLGAVLPSNSPGVHSLWIPAIALKTPLVLKPGREEPWSPYRIIQAFVAAGVPAAAFGFYPTDHAGAAELLRTCDRSMLFGGGDTTKPYENDPRVELHGPGYSKVILGPDAASEWEKHLDLMVGSIAANGGRSCINASGIWTPKNGRAIAEALAERLAKVQALPADDPKAEIAAFANPKMAEMISLSIDAQLTGGAIDLTAEKRGSPRLAKQSRARQEAVTAPAREIAWLLPTIIWIEPRTNGAAISEAEALARRVPLPDPSIDNEATPWSHPLANKEFLFPFAAVVECPAELIPDAIGPTLVGTVISRDQKFLAAMSASENIDRLNLGPIPTYQLSWDQPHEGNLFEHLYRQRAFQMVVA
ncbi:MAG TPA: aldehyde dehydrogenase family protein [Phycisphaerae bacterium]|nr:aldehyde dehydrogenase family protein [Phycisphaerae bacterium]